MAKQDLAQIGEWAFIIGVIIAIVAGIVAVTIGVDTLVGGIEIGGIITLVLVILGIIIGLLNITDKETEKFLVAAIALMATSAISAFANINLLTNPAKDLTGLMLGTWIVVILGYIGVLVAPAAIIVALKSIKNLASSK